MIKYGIKYGIRRCLYQMLYHIVYQMRQIWYQIAPRSTKIHCFGTGDRPPPPSLSKSKKIMVGKSRWDGYKPVAAKMLAEGKSIAEIMRALGIPRQTLLRWRNKWQENPVEVVRAVGGVEAIAPPSPSNLILLPQPEPEEELTDYELSRWALRGVIRCPTQPGASIAVRAAQSLIRLILLKAKLPKHILEDSLDPAEEKRIIREELEKMTPEEIAKEYYRLIDNT